MDYKFRTISKEAFIADLQRIGFDPYRGRSLDVDNIILEEKAKLQSEISDMIKETEKVTESKTKEVTALSLSRTPMEDTVWEKIKARIPKEKLESMERIEDKIKYNGYSQDFDACIRWNGVLIIGQEYDENGDLISKGTEIDGYFVDLRTEEPLVEGFESLMQDTVLDDRYPHTFS